MDFLIFLSLIAAGAALIVPWVTLYRSARNRREIARLSRHIQMLADAFARQGGELPDSLKSPPNLSAPPAPAPGPASPAPAALAPESLASPPLSAPASGVAEIGFERFFAGRMAVWIGGVALALAGFFLVRYTIEQGLLGPGARVILAAAAGLALLAGAETLQRLEREIANRRPIAQSLAGAGIVILYVAVFAATNLYNFLSPFFGFAGMAAITLAAIILSLRHGAPIAVFALVGGFLTPALIQTPDPSALRLFLYLYMLFAALFFIARARNWWPLSLAAFLGAALWTGLWLNSALFSAADAPWLFFFLIATATTIALGSSRRFKTEIEAAVEAKDKFFPAALLNYAGLAAILALAGVVAARAGFAPEHFLFFGCLAAGALALAWFDDKLYDFVPWAALLVNLSMLLAWRAAPAALAPVVLGFALLFAGGGYALLWRAHRPALWAGLSAAAGLAYYLLAFFKLREAAALAELPVFWGLLALALAAACAYAVQEIMRRCDTEHPHYHHILAVFAAAAAAFAVLAAVIELEYRFVPVAFALQAFVVAWLAWALPVKALRPIAFVLAAGFGLLMIAEAGFLVLWALTAVAGSQEGLQAITRNAAVFDGPPLFYFGLPALSVAAAALYLRRRRDSRAVQSLEAAAAALFTLMIYLLVRQNFHPGESVFAGRAGFFERNLITNLFFACGLGFGLAGLFWRRTFLAWSGSAIFLLAAARVAWFDLGIHNPLWDAQQIDGILVFNTLLLPYGLPLLWLVAARRGISRLRPDLRPAALPGWLPGLRAAPLFLLFVLVSLNVRFFFQEAAPDQGGVYLNQGGAGDAEIYIYSAVWLLLGFAFLFAAILTRDRVLRYASLAVIAPATLKVFLYDAAGLEGLYRVASFAGLGASLIGLSYFYMNFVFAEDRRARPGPNPRPPDL